MTVGLPTLYSQWNIKTIVLSMIKTLNQIFLNLR